MLPHIRHIQRLVVEEQDEHDDSEVDVGFAKGMERVEDEEVGCDESKV